MTMAMYLGYISGIQYILYNRPSTQVEICVNSTGPSINQTCHIETIKPVPYDITVLGHITNIFFITLIFMLISGVSFLRLKASLAMWTEKSKHLALQVFMYFLGFIAIDFFISGIWSPYSVITKIVMLYISLSLTILWILLAVLMMSCFVLECKHEEYDSINDNL